jgi:hypothetical protein
MSYVKGSLVNGWAIVDVLIGASRTHQVVLRKHESVVPQAVHVRALLDTGASISGFSPRVFQELGISPITKMDVLTPSTPSNKPHICDVYDVSLALVANGAVRPFPDARVMVADCWLQNEGIEALHGMDILRSCFFQLFGPEGQFTLAFQS